MNPRMTMPIRMIKMQHIPNKIKVSESGGFTRCGAAGSVGCPLLEEVGMAVGVAWSTTIPEFPEIGTMVGTNVGLGCRVGCAETARGSAPIA